MLKIEDKTANAVLDPGSEMFVAFSTESIGAAEKDASHAAKYDVVVGRVGNTQQVFSCFQYALNDTRVSVNQVSRKSLQYSLKCACQVNKFECS